MAKLRLDLSELAVETFGTGEPIEPIGTVQGHYILSNQRCNSDYSCQAYTCDFLSCNDSDCGKCIATYGDSCDIICNYTGSTSCNLPCVPTCDGWATCDINNTCVSTCPGLPNC